MEVRRKNYPHMAQPVGPYVHATQYNGQLFLSGLTAFGTPAQGGAIAQQAKTILRQIADIAKEENTDLSSLVKVTLFVTGFDGLEDLREVLTRTYDGNLPASSLVQVARLFSPDINIEMEAILAVGSTPDN